MESNGSSIANDFASFLSFNMLVFVVIAMTVTVTNVASLCPNANINGTIDCSGQGYTTIPELPKQALRV